jgi:hypothetical protein
MKRKDSGKRIEMIQSKKEGKIWDECVRNNGVEEHNKTNTEQDKRTRKQKKDKMPINMISFLKRYKIEILCFSSLDWSFCSLVNLSCFIPGVQTG